MTQNDKLSFDYYLIGFHFESRHNSLDPSKWEQNKLHFSEDQYFRPQSKTELSQIIKS